jgi:putative cyclase
MDGLNHLQVGDRTYNGFRLADIVEDHGTNRLGIDTLPQVVTRGLLLDVAAARGVGRLGPGDVVTVTDAEKALAAIGGQVCPRDAVFFHTGAGRLLLSSPAVFDVEGATATARLHLAAGETVMFALAYAPMWEPPLTAWGADQIVARLDDTAAGWRSWSAIHQTYEGPWRDLVHHSGRVLQALTFAPTGASATFPSENCRTWPGGATATRCGSATAPGASGSWTCTASCSAPPPGWSNSWGISTQSRNDSSLPPPTPPPLAGRRRTRASGRSGATRRISCTPS